MIARVKFGDSRLLSVICAGRFRGEAAWHALNFQEAAERCSQERSTDPPVAPAPGRCLCIASSAGRVFLRRR